MKTTPGTILSFIDVHTVDGAHHKQWVIDQVVRLLTDCPRVKKEGVDCNGKPYSYYALGESEEYKRWVADRKKAGYDWEEGIAP